MGLCRYVLCWCVGVLCVHVIGVVMCYVWCMLYNVVLLIDVNVGACRVVLGGVCVVYNVVCVSMVCVCCV